MNGFVSISASFAVSFLKSVKKASFLFNHPAFLLCCFSHFMTYQLFFFFFLFFFFLATNGSGWFCSSPWFRRPWEFSKCKQPKWAWVPARAQKTAGGKKLETGKKKKPSVAPYSRYSRTTHPYMCICVSSCDLWGWKKEDNGAFSGSRASINQYLNK